MKRTVLLLHIIYATDNCTWYCTAITWLKERNGPVCLWNMQMTQNRSHFAIPFWR